VNFFFFVSKIAPLYSLAWKLCDLSPWLGVIKWVCWHTFGLNTKVFLGFSTNFWTCNVFLFWKLCHWYENYVKKSWGRSTSVFKPMVRDDQISVLTCFYAQHQSFLSFLMLYGFFTQVLNMKLVFFFVLKIVPFYSFARKLCDLSPWLRVIKRVCWHVFDPTAKFLVFSPNFMMCYFFYSNIASLYSIS